MILRGVNGVMEPTLPSEHTTISHIVRCYMSKNVIPIRKLDIYGIVGSVDFYQKSIHLTFWGITHHQNKQPTALDIYNNQIGNGFYEGMEICHWSM